MSNKKLPRRICAETLEARRLFSQIAADFSSPIKDPGAFVAGQNAVMNATTTYPLSAEPQLSSDPGAPATIYLNFTGNTTSSWLSYVPGTTPAYDTDGDPTTFSSTELSNITAIWEQVADTYAPFNVNVTTVNPGTTANPNLEVVIGGTGTWTGGTYGGVAYVGSFAGSTVVYGANKNEVFVFPKNLSNGVPKYVADDAEHEAGHAFGLSHQSDWTENTTTNPPTYTLTAEYNTGNTNGLTGPIMGSPISDQRAMWWDGTTDYEVNNAPAIQDDMAVISQSANGFGYRSDDYGNSIATATPLSGSGNVFSTNGVISTNTDADFFAINVPAESISIDAIAGGMYSSPNPTLNVDLQLFNSSGTLVSSGTQTTLSKSISTTLTAGTYYVEVSGDGTYGDVGSYSLNIGGVDRYEANDSFAQAADLGPVVTSIQANLSINASGNDDYYAFTPVSSGSLDTNIHFANTGGALGIYLYNSSQGLISSATSTTASVQDVSGTVIGGQKYYVRVAGLSGATNANYTLNITAPTPTWLSNVNNLTYTFGGTSANPTLSINSGTGLMTADAGSILSNLNVSVAAGAVLQMQTSEHLNSLQLASGTLVQVLQGTSSELYVNSLSLPSGSTLDLADNAMLWTGASLSTVQNLLTSGYDGGEWDGTGIISTTAANRMYFGLGYSDNNVPGAVLVKYTQDGDANLDGVVNADDMSLIAFGEKSGGSTWQTGDFNYDGKVTADDFFLADLASAFQNETPSMQTTTAPVG
ncbi:MAG TPA: T9SS type A sorting domain-containing protein [Tepidisphaeraceae bacterium]|jgi:hypothetical protein